MIDCEHNFQPGPYPDEPRSCIWCGEFKGDAFDSSDAARASRAELEARGQMRLLEEPENLLTEGDQQDLRELDLQSSHYAKAQEVVCAAAFGVGVPSPYGPFGTMDDPTPTAGAVAVQRLCEGLLANPKHLRELLDRRVRYLWLRPVGGAQPFEYVEALNYPYEAPRGGSVSLEGLWMSVSDEARAALFQSRGASQTDPEDPDGRVGPCTLPDEPQAQQHIDHGHAQLEVRMDALMAAQGATRPATALPVFAQTPQGAFDYAYDARSAHCSSCQLTPTADGHCPGRAPRAPETFNGLMIVWGFPTQRAIRLGDASGGNMSILQQALRRHGLEYEDAYVTHAIACNIPQEMDRNDIPANVFDSCRYKLLTEVQNIQPRVILALGSVAFTAVMGDQVMKTRREAYDCPTCSNERTWRLWGCAKCKTSFRHLPWTDAKVQPEGTPWAHFCGCVKEDGSHAVGPKGKPVNPPKWQKHVEKCGDCNGLKTKEVQLPTFSCGYNLTGKGGMAGGAFTVDRTPLGHLYPEAARANTYFIGTYDPHSLHNKAATDAQKQILGQFLLPAFDAHVAKASRLLAGQAPKWDLQWASTKDPLVLREFMTATAFAQSGPELWLAGAKPLDFDIETDNKDPILVTDIRCVGIHRRADGRILVLETAGMTVESSLVQELKHYMGRGDLRWAAQNGVYDLRVLERLWGIPVPETWTEDSLVAHTLLLSDAPHDLGHIAFQFTDAPPWKPPKNSNGFGQFDSSEQLHLYNARDCRATGLALEAMKPELVAEGIEHLLDFDMRKQRIALRMGAFGVPVNRQVMLQRTADQTFIAEKALRAMREIVGLVPDALVSDGAMKDAKAEKRDPRLFNPNSQRQLQWALYTRLGLAPLNPQAPSADKEALLPHMKVPFVQTLMRYRGADKLRTTIGNIPIGQDGRFHPEWKPQGAVTGRWSSSPNFQNWQGATKTMVEAPEGRVFVGADFSQLELRIIAALAGDEKMIDLCANAQEDRKLEPDFDPHSYITAISFGQAFTSLSLKDPSCTAKKDYTKTCLCETCRRKTYRDITKRTIYALAYGGDEHTVLAGIYNDGYDGPPITLQMVQRTVEAYFAGFTKVKPWREGVLREAKRTGYVREMMGGRYRCFPLGQVDDTVAYNYGVQGAASAVVDTSVITLDEQLRARYDGRNQIFATVHDAVYVECDIADAKEVSNLVEECLSCEVRFNGGPWMALPASANIALNWKDAA